MRRFYREATATAMSAGAAAGFHVLLDGRALKTPAKLPLLLPTRALAEAVAAEWQAQPETIEPYGMPLMRLAATALDRVAVQRPRVVDEVAAYGGSDLLCYRAERPDALVQRQEAAWQPVLDWLARRFDAPLQVTCRVIAIPQSEQALNRLHDVVAAQSDLALAALHALTTGLGSLALALAVAEGWMAPAAAAAAAHLDEIYQAEGWGEDAEALARRAAMAKEINASARFLSLLRA